MRLCRLILRQAQDEVTVNKAVSNRPSIAIVHLIETGLDPAIHRPVDLDFAGGFE